MPDAPALVAAFDAALRQVERALADGLATQDGGPARPMLEHLRDDLSDRRTTAEAGGGVDAAWVRETVRAVASWTPDSELALLAALGGIARAGSGTSG